MRSRKVKKVGDDQVAEKEKIDTTRLRKWASTMTFLLHRILAAP